MSYHNDLPLSLSLLQIFPLFIDFIDIRAGRDLGRSSSPAPCPKGRKSAGIDGLEEKLALCRQNMEEVDFKLRREELSPEKRYWKSLEREKTLLMTKAESYEKELRILRKENRKNAALTMALMLLITVIYVCWTM
uniref:Coiled-coil domain-containing protein 167 n=1 Tax=Crocodylus porosus TaxID=8502 RepID=A0A7M4EUB7_CROPO